MDIKKKVCFLSSLLSSVLYQILNSPSHFLLRSVRIIHLFHPFNVILNSFEIWCTLNIHNSPIWCVQFNDYLYIHRYVQLSPQPILEHFIISKRNPIPFNSHPLPSIAAPALGNYFLSNRFPCPGHFLPMGSSNTLSFITGFHLA